jgi:hypothetical protein
MNGVLTVIVMTSAIAIFAAEHASAVDSISHPTINKRQLIEQIVGCMKKRMTASKTISYNEAAKVCKDQINGPNDNSPSGTLVASDTTAKP